MNGRDRRHGDECPCCVLASCPSLLISRYLFLIQYLVRTICHQSVDLLELNLLEIVKFSRVISTWLAPRYGTPLIALSEFDTDFQWQYDSASTDGKFLPPLSDTSSSTTAKSILPEVSEPIIVDVSKPDNYTSRTNESASSARQRIAEYFEPGTYPSIYDAVEMGSFPGM